MIENNEKMPDVLDQASELELRANEGRVRMVMEKCKPQQHPRSDGTYAITECDECGGDIGAERLKVAIQNLLCIGCATALEKRNAWHA